MRNCHWLTVSSIGYADGHIQVFDSLPSGDVPTRTKEQIAAMLFTSNNQIILQFPNVQVQRGSADCGLFAIASAMPLCAGEDPCSTNYIQHDLRHHLVTCFEENRMSLFPA